MRPARLTIDARHLKTGIGAYTSNLIVNLNQLQFGPLQILTGSKNVAQLTPYCQKLSIVNAPIYSIIEQISIPLTLESNSVLHVPHYNVPLLHRGPLLTTIHDITHILYQEYADTWKSRLYGLPMMRAAAQRAAHLFTVSEYSKRKIVETFRISPDKITVVYNGVGAVFFRSDAEHDPDHLQRHYGISRPYVLYVGSLKPHKNIETLLRAHAHVAPGQQPDFELVIAGGGKEGKLKLGHLAAQLGIRPIFVQNASDDDLADLYRGAQVLVLPSFEEGFGLPIVEAMACATPVICANTASMPEIAGDAALLFDPRDDRDLARQLSSVLSSAERRFSLVQRGLVRAKIFTWQDTTSRHIPVYDKFAQ